MNKRYIQAVPTPFMQQQNIASKFIISPSFGFFNSEPRFLTLKKDNNTGRIQHKQKMSFDIDPDFLKKATKAVNKLRDNLLKRK